MFRGDDAISRSELMRKLHIQELRGTLIFLGYGLSPMTRYLVLSLLFEPDKTWWGNHSQLIGTNWEYAHGHKDFLVDFKEAVKIARNKPEEFTPSAAMTLRSAARLKGL